MYELPEIEMVRANITEKFSGIPIQRIYVNAKALLGKRIKFLDEITHATIWFVERRCAHLILHLDNGKRILIEIGKDTKFYGDDVLKINKDEADLIFYFENKTCAFYHLDEEALQLLTVREVDQQLKIIAPDAFDKSFTHSYFVDALAKKRSSIKNALIDGKIVSGIHEIYSDEILFEGKIHPTRKANTLSDEEVNRLYTAIQYVLKEATTDGGSLKEPLSSHDVFSGSYADKLNVYNRADENCLICDTPIEQIVLSKQKCYICPKCQA